MGYEFTARVSKECEDAPREGLMVVNCWKKLEFLRRIGKFVPGPTENKQKYWKFDDSRSNFASDFLVDCWYVSLVILGTDPDGLRE